MRKPASIDEERPILEMYNSLRDEVKNTRVRAAQPANDSDQFVSEKRLRESGAEIKSCVGKKIDALALSLMGPTKLEHLISLQDLLIKILWAILEVVRDRRKDRIYVDFFL